MEHERERRRLDELSRMTHGWYGEGEGKVPTPAAIETARHFLESAELIGVRVYVYPTLEGGVQLEWGEGHEFHIGPSGYGELIL